MKKDLFTLYGLSKTESVINEIVEELKCHNYYFDLKLILTEALTNAFKHGNEMDEKKPIYLRYEYIKDTRYIKIEIEDSGSDLQNIEIVDEITDDMIQDTSGRGLFLIKCMCDNLYFEEKSMIIEKCLN